MLPVNPAVETRYVVQRELRKSFRSIKGIILAILTAAGGGGLALLFAQSDAIRQEQMKDAKISTDALTEFKRILLTEWFMDKDTGAHLAPGPGLLFFLFAVSIVMMPSLVLLLGFDTVSADRQHKTVRYWTIRSRRSSYIIGKFLGLWATVGVVTFAMHLLIWIICIARGEAPFAQVIGWGFRYWLASMPILAMWCAVSTFMSSLFRIPIVGLLSTAAVFFLWWLLYIPFWTRGHVGFFALMAGRMPPEELAKPSTVLYFYPNFYDRLLLSPNAGQFLSGLAVCFGFTAALLAAGSALFAKRDV